MKKIYKILQNRDDVHGWQKQACFCLDSVHLSCTEQGIAQSRFDEKLNERLKHTWAVGYDYG